ncbi:MAG: hypothetical protein A3D31_18740 [Candidatus Fluviicola riflensis]|nr:MAG: hypothetical protein CHH17_03420 [Candidatus Fluviicola riflensis]OGS76485.1 MAG: hypothetical protein A3D31_18740 [Candidatus Fluviicola riflensis]OGS82779.1 MAG: hypothetical protein A2724_13565 [Fluviicola sp. RIFCSPHIGHO2_01_FULL_43_53]OGS89078.1 MAG: hypothetical protein A3E30_17225 [Fluviicola sp. RIFCSPHIGHO2_12_FULL_43_24]
MDFEKKYPITQQPGDFVTVQWSRGYKAVDLYYKNELIGSVQGSATLKAGTKITDTVLGTIGLKLSEKPVMLDVIIDGYHSPVNVSHPVKELKKTATFFWIIAVFSFIAGAIEVGVFRDTGTVEKTVMTINGSVLIIYIITAVYVGKGKVWAYYLGFSVFAFFTLFTLLVLFGGIMWGFLLYLFQVFRFGALGLLIYNIKTANAARKHQQYASYNDAELLDSKL